MNLSEFTEKYRLSLNEQQLSAVSAVEGPVLLLAVPGSGKTTVLVARLGYMVLCRGIDPQKILTLTYTVAATGDMRRRFQSLFGAEVPPGVEFRTINGISAKVIAYYSRLVNREPFRLCTDEKEILRALSLCYREVTGEFPQEADLKNIRTLITYIKNRMLSPEEITALDEENDCPVSEIYKAYQQFMRQERLMDYDDQLVYALRILRQSPETLAALQERFPYVLVDEAQDTSRIQHEIIRLVAERSGNLFMVGDEDQSIYGFRAACPEALLSFEKDHPGAKVLLMEKNYRSRKEIVQAADRLIRKNRLRHPKAMQAAREEEQSREDGKAITTVRVRNRAAQYSYLAKLAAENREETAVLYRDNESVIPLLDLLSRRGIPYRMRSVDAAFFSHRIVTDVSAILRLSLDPKDTEAFLSVYYKLGIYLNKKAAMSIADLSERNGISVFRAALRMPGLPPYSYDAIRKLQEELSRAGKSTGGEAFDSAVYNTGYYDWTARNGLSTGKLSILKAVAAREPSPEDFLRRLIELKSLMLETSSGDSSGEIVPLILSTIHQSKGLEYRNVYLMDAADGIFPETVPGTKELRDPEIRAAFEEERRLFYVGMTRAKEHLFIFKTAQASVFHRDICPEYYGKK